MRGMWKSLPGLVLVLALVLAGCGEQEGDGGSISEEFSFSGPQRTVQFAVGSKDFAEQEILGHVMIEALEAAGADVNNRVGIGGTEELRRALVSGDVDMYWEYTGTGWLVHLGQSEPLPDPQEQYEAVAEQDLEQNGVEWLDPAPANNTYAVAASQETANRLEVDRISDFSSLLQEDPGEATLCVGPEFRERADGLPGLEQAYGLEFPAENVSVVSDSSVYSAVDQAERCNFGSVFRTDGRITELGLRLLEDDEGFFATYNPTPVMLQETLEEYPDLEDLFAPISEGLDTETLRELSAAVEVEGESPAAVARQWLRDNGFIG